MRQRAEAPSRLNRLLTLVSCSVVAKDFPNALGKFTPCFTNIAILGKVETLMGFWQGSFIHLLISACYPDISILSCIMLLAGTAHVVAIILCITRVGLASRSKGVEKYRLSGSARAVHCVAAIAAAANLLLVLFLLNGRIAADTILVVQGKLAPFEWVGKNL